MADQVDSDEKRAELESQPETRGTPVFEMIDDEGNPIAASTQQDYSDSGMIALVPSEADAERLALEGGEVPEQLHLTLAYLGEIAEWTGDDRDALADTIGTLAAELKPFSADAFGVAHWNPTGDNPSWVLSVGGGDLEQVHAETWDAISDAEIPAPPSQHTPWVAHVCLAYSTDPEVMQQALDSGGGIEFDRIRFAFGDEVFDFPLGGTLTSSTHMEASPMPWYIEKDHEGCSDDTPWAVVKQDDDEIAGCHATKQEALDQLAALYANENEEGEDMAEDKQCPPGQEPGPDGECVPIEETASAKRSRVAKARRKFADDGPPEPECPPGHKPGPDGECVPEDDEGEDAASGEVRATGVATREGEWTGDGRMFADSSLDWPDPTKVSIPLQWQKETSHGGINDVTVNVGWLTALERVDGGQIAYEAIIDTDSADGLEAARFVAKRGQFGVSIVADDPAQAEIEFVYPEGCEEASADEEVEFVDDMRCWTPNVIYHSGRIRALTLVDVPAFADAYIEIPDADAVVASVLGGFGAVPVHETDTSDADWNASAEEGKLESPMNVDTARAMYGWIDDEQIENDQVTKEACKFPHHDVSEDGTPGPANLAACSAGIGALNGAREEPGIPAEDFQGVYDHLAAHLANAGQEPPEPQFETSEALMAASYSIEIPDLPPVDWYSEPTELPEVGAIKITDEGRFYGLLAPRGVAHRSFADRKITVPMGNVDYSRWMNRETIVAGGKRIVAGPVTMDCGHASTNAGVSAQASRDHYDNSCSVVATVRIGENRDGVWVAGSLLPGVTAQQIAQMMACQLSGDWRPHPDKPGKREMCGALLVPVPGFPKANASQASVLLDNGQLVAATAPISWETTGTEPVELEIGGQSDEPAGLDLPTWEEIQARQTLRAKAQELATKLGIEVK